MPRSGVTGTYTLPPGTDNQVAGTPISPTMFNAFADDVEQTNNTPVPIAYGGTASATGPDGLYALGLRGFAKETTEQITNADTTLTGGRYYTPSTWTGSVFPGTQGLNQGYLDVVPWGGSGELLQKWTSINPAYGEFTRLRNAGVWQPWNGYTSGSNSNGSWERHPNGLQICRTEIVTSALNVVAGAIFSTAPYLWTFPNSFLAGAVVTTTGTDSASENVWLGTGAYSSVNVSIKAFCFTAASARTLNLTAVGRWK